MMSRGIEIEDSSEEEENDKEKMHIEP